MNYHQYANLFPMMNEQERQGLLEDMRKNGYRRECPIVTYRGELLDGRNRYETANILGIEPTYNEYDGNDPLGYVIGMNLNRRHLNETQRGVVASKLANLQHGGDRKSVHHSVYQEANLPLDNAPSPKEAVSIDEAATMLNVSPRTIKTVKAVEKASPELMELMEKGKITASRAYKEVKRQENSSKPTPPIPSTKYRVIYADPPWQYNSGDQHSREEQETVLGTYYNSMSIAELCSLPVRDLVEENAVLFLWVTSPLLEECFDVIQAWGFKYKTSIVWNKEAHNVGHYVSVRHELLLICTKGSCLPDVKKLHPSIVSEKRTEHSVKPETFRQMIDAMYPNGNRIELFARKEVEGWSRWGNDVS